MYMRKSNSLFWPLVKSVLLVVGSIGLASALTCRVAQFEVIVQPTERQDNFVCQVVYKREDGSSAIGTHQYGLDLSETMSQEVKRRVVAREDTFVKIPGGKVIKSTTSIFVPDKSVMTFISAPDELAGRNLQSSTARWWETNNGKLTLLPIRIHTSDGLQPSFNDDKLYKYLFVEPNSLKWQFHQCSFGKLYVEPTDLGVLDIYIDIPVGTDHNLLVNKATTAAIEHINALQGTNNMVPINSPSIQSNSFDGLNLDGGSLVDYADLIMFITPPMDGWIAFGSVGGRTSVYNDKWGAYLGVQLHEIGHNFLLQHSNEIGLYDDYTGAMGGAIIGYHDKFGYPRLCYNAYNHYLLGWYEDRTIAIDPNFSQIVTLAAFVDYSKASASEYVVAVISDQYYMQFNRAKDFNSDTYEYQDHLVVVHRLADGTGTKLVTALNGFDESTYTGSFTAGATASMLTIEICGWGQGNANRPDYLTVSVGFGQSLCPGRRNLQGADTEVSSDPFHWSHPRDISNLRSLPKSIETSKQHEKGSNGSVRRAI